jgi:Uma2 family endonuclease
MTTERRIRFVTVEEYLSREEASSIKHEYVAGVMYAMVGATNRHNLIAMNVGGFLLGRLRGKPCRAFNSDTKIRLQLTSGIRFYYPDVSVVCRQNSLDDVYQDTPRVIFEVLSRSTRRVDLSEKKDAYLGISSLGAYVLVEPEVARLIVHRRTERGFVEEILEGITAVLALPEIEVSLPLAEVYEGVDLDANEPPEPDEV